MEICVICMAYRHAKNERICFIDLEPCKGYWYRWYTKKSVVKNSIEKSTFLTMKKVIILIKFFKGKYFQVPQIYASGP